MSVINLPSEDELNDLRPGDIIEICTSNTILFDNGQPVCFLTVTKIIETLIYCESFEGTPYICKANDIIQIQAKD